MAGEGFSEAVTLFEAKELNPDAVDGGGFGEDGRDPDKAGLLTREGEREATGVEATKELNPDALEGVSA